MDLEDNTRDEQGRTPEQALRERERAVEMREMRLAARQALRDRALPDALSGALSYVSPEALEKSLNAAEQAFRVAVEHGVLERMRGEAPARATTHRLSDDMSDEDYYNLYYAKKRK